MLDVLSAIIASKVSGGGSGSGTGPQGPAGADGYTPVKGVDYWTEADKTEIVSDVLSALPTWEGGAY